MNWKLIFVFSLFMYACSSETIIEDHSSRDFKKIDSLVLVMDEIGSVDKTTIASYYDDSGGAVAIIRTSIDKRYIDIFDVNTGELLNRIPIEYEGPNGVGSEISNMVISNPDSVYIFNQWTGFLSLHRADGKIIHKYKVNFNELGGRGYLSPGSWSYQNYIIHKNKMYFPGWLPWAHQAKSTEQIGVVDLQKNEVFTRFSRPEQYETYTWGAGNLYELYMDYHSDSEELLLSFPIENDLILLNPESGETRRVRAISKHFSEVTPFSPDFENLDVQGLMDHDKNNKYYQGVVFDPSNNFTYRMTSRSTYQMDVNQSNQRLVSLIILDENFNALNEIELDLKNLDFKMGFTANKGWYILNQKLTYDKEGQLVFDIYSYR